MRIVKTLMAVAALLGSATAFAGVPSWSVSESSGPVLVSRPGLQPIALRSGVLHAGDVVSTGKSGRAVLVRGEEYLIVSPGTRITIADAKPGAITQIIQSVGNTLFKIKKMATPHFAVETPYMAAVVKGTTFSVTVTGSGASVQVTEGRVEVATRDGGAAYLVTPGEIGLVSRNAPYRLTVQGRETITLDSPNKPAGAETAPATKPAAEKVSIETFSALDGSIKSGVGEGKVDLGDLSGGLIGGNSALAVASSSARTFVKGAELAEALPMDDSADGTKGSAPALARGGNGTMPGGIVGAGAGLSNGGSDADSGSKGNGNGGGNGNSGGGSGNSGNGNGHSGSGNSKGNNGNGHGNGGGSGNSGGGKGNGNGNGHGHGGKGK